MCGDLINDSVNDQKVLIDIELYVSALVFTINYSSAHLKPFNWP